MLLYAVFLLNLVIQCVVHGPMSSPALPWNAQEALGTLSRTGSLDLSGVGRAGPIGDKYRSILVHQCMIGSCLRNPRDEWVWTGLDVFRLFSVESCLRQMPVSLTG